MSLFDLIVAIVYMACLAIEIVGLVGAFVVRPTSESCLLSPSRASCLTLVTRMCQYKKNKAIIVRIYSLASIGGVALVACGGQHQTSPCSGTATDEKTHPILSLDVRRYHSDHQSVFLGG
jgi:hypothetical protein